MKTSRSTQDYTRCDLPEGAKVRLGTGYLTGNMLYSPDGALLVIPKSSGIWVYDTSTLEVVDMISEYRVFNSSEIRNDQWCELIEVDNAVGFSSEGNLFAVRVAWQYCVLPPTSEIYTIRIWSREIEQSERISIECPEKIDSMVLSPDGTTLAGSKNGTIYLWNVHTGELQNILTVKAKKIDSMVFSPDGLTLASTSWVGTGQFGISPDGDTYESIHSSIDVWDTRTGRHKFNLYGAGSLLGFSHDGQMLAGGIHGDSVALWDANTGACEFTFTRYPPSVLYPYSTTPPDSYTDTSALGSATCLAFSPDGLTLASFNRDTIHLWDYHTGNCKSTFTGTGYITSLVFSPDGLTLAGGCEDGTVLLWDIDSDRDETVLTDDNPFIIPTIKEIRDNPFSHEQPDIFDIDSDNNETVFKVKDTEPQSRTSQIQQLCEERGITTLFHFTRIENLQSILQEGLIGRSLLETRGQQFLWNDPKRADGRKEAVCLSISFPNYKMFWEIRREKENTEEIRDSHWIVLLLDAKVLWKLDCAFCQTNAASGAVRSLLSDERIGEQKKFEVLESIFAEDYYDSKREIQISHQNLQIPKHYTTDPQAEVLVFDPISSKYIKEVHFYNHTALQTWQKDNPGTHAQKFYSNPKYFKYRRDYKAWQN